MLFSLGAFINLQMRLIPSAERFNCWYMLYVNDESQLESLLSELQQSRIMMNGSSE